MFRREENEHFISLLLCKIFICLLHRVYRRSYYGQEAEYTVRSISFRVDLT